MESAMPNSIRRLCRLLSPQRRQRCYTTAEEEPACRLRKRGRAIRCGSGRRVGACKGPGGGEISENPLERPIKLGGEDILQGTRRSEAWRIRSVPGEPLRGECCGRI